MRDFPCRIRGRWPLVALGCLALALGIAACGGGETTVTVTETVPAGAPPKNGTAAKAPSAEVDTGNGAVAGYVDNAREEGERLVLNGWAASSDLSGPADKVTALVEGNSVAEAVPALQRQDVVEALGKPGLKDSGFEMRLPIGSLECGAPAAGVTVRGSLGGESSNLPYSEGIKAAIAKAC